MTAAPFLLVRGNIVYAQVLAINIYGSSSYSSVGGGAVIQLIPDAPLNLANDFTQRSAEHIRVTWVAGLSDGGSAVIAHDIYCDQSNGTWILLAGGMVNTYSYTTTIPLIQGNIYSFKVWARNAVGQGPFSAVLQVLAAQ